MSTSISYEIVKQRLSSQRFAPYEAAIAGGTIQDAFALYEWNLAVSASLFQSIGIFEVVLRNALHDQLTKARGERWYHGPWLVPAGQEDVERALERAGDPEIPGKVVAELPLSFWKFLVSRRYHTELWVPFLYRAFPRHNDAARQRFDIENRIASVHILRNRLAHHEPVHRRNLQRDFDNIVLLTSWICDNTRAWLVACSNFSTVHSQRPG